MEHIARIASGLESLGLDAMLVSSAPGEFYATGFHGEGYAIITKAACRYTTDARYIEAAQKIQGAEIICISPEKGHPEYAAETVEAWNIKRLGIEDEYMSVQEHTKLCSLMPEVEFVPASEYMAQLRAVKDEEELNCIRGAQDITDRAFTEILNFIRPGVSEMEIAARLTYLQMSMGASVNSFNPIVASGPNGSMPHAIPSEKLIKQGEFVTLDFGCMFGGYCSDMTRTVCVGKPTEEMEKVYYTVLEAQQAGIELCRGGVIGSAVHNAAADVIAKAGYGEYFGHGYGHSLGIEIHENPRANAVNHKPIPAGAVLSAEPGIYLPGRFGVRIEDLIIYRENGYEDITKSPKELICL